MRHFIHLITLCVLAGCHAPKQPPSPSLVKAQHSSLRLDWLPADREGGEELIHLQASFFLKKETLDRDKTLPLQLQYGIDRSFYLLGAKDTVWPTYVLPVANGQPLKPQYLVGFSRQDLRGVSAVRLKSSLWNSQLFDSCIYLNLKNIN